VHIAETNFAADPKRPDHAVDPLMQSSGYEGLIQLRTFDTYPLTKDSEYLTFLEKAADELADCDQYFQALHNRLNTVATRTAPSPLFFKGDHYAQQFRPMPAPSEAAIGFGLQGDFGKEFSSIWQQELTPPITPLILPEYERPNVQTPELFEKKEYLAEDEALEEHDIQDLMEDGKLNRTVRELTYPPSREGDQSHIGTFQSLIRATHNADRANAGELKSRLGRRNFEKVCEKANVLPLAFFIEGINSSNLSYARYNMGNELAIGLSQTLKKRGDSGTPVVWLNIRANSITKKSALDVVEGIAALRNLTSLDISENNFGTKAIAALTHMIARPAANEDSTTKDKDDVKPTVERESVSRQNSLIRSSSFKLEKHSALLSVSLDSSHLSTEDVNALCSAAARCQALTTISFRDNAINAAAGVPQLLHHASSLHHLDLCENNLKDAGAEGLAHAMMQHVVPLETLLLRSNGISDVGCKVLMEMLENNKSLRLLDLSKNHIREQGSRAIGEMLGGPNETFTQLDLSYNPLGEAGGVAILKGLQDSKGRVKVLMDGCNLTLQAAKTSAFDPDNPTGRYTLKMNKEHDKSVLYALMKLANEQGWKSIQKATHNGKKVKITQKWWDKKPGALSSGTWMIEFVGLQQTSDEAKHDPAEVNVNSKADFILTLSQLHSDVPRLHVLKALCQEYQIYCSDMPQFAKLFTYGESQLTALTTLCAFVEDPVQLSEVCKKILDKPMVKRLKAIVGSLWYFDPLAPSGHYQLKLSHDVDRMLLKRLQMLSTRNAAKLEANKLKCTSVCQTEEWHSFRNSMIDGKAVPLAGKSCRDLGLLEQGFVEFDYIMPNVLPLSKGTMSSNFFKREASRFETEFSINPTKALYNLNELLRDFSFSGEQVAELMSVPPEQDPHRVDIAVALWPVFADIKQVHYIHNAAGPENLLALQTRIGHLPMFSPFLPDGEYTLNLAIFEQRKVAMILSKLYSITGDGQLSQSKLGGKKYTGYEGWMNLSQGAPKKGIWTVRYITRQASYPERQRIAEQELNWKFGTPEHVAKFVEEVKEFERIKQALALKAEEEARAEEERYQQALAREQAMLRRQSVGTGKSRRTSLEFTRRLSQRTSNVGAQLM